MLRNVRHGMFETNSSSVHTVALSRSSRRPFVGGGILRIDFGEFGWGPERLTMPDEKLSYLLTAIPYYCNIDTYNQNTHEEDPAALDAIKATKHWRWICEAIRDYSGCELEPIPATGDFYHYGYIDHQSAPGEDPALIEVWSDDEATFKANVIDLVFGERSVIVIDNDNH